MEAAVTGQRHKRAQQKRQHERGQQGRAHRHKRRSKGGHAALLATLAVTAAPALTTALAVSAMPAAAEEVKVPVIAPLGEVAVRIAAPAQPSAQKPDTQKPTAQEAATSKPAAPKPVSEPSVVAPHTVRTVRLTPERVRDTDGMPDADAPAADAARPLGTPSLGAPPLGTPMATTARPQPRPNPDSSLGPTVTPVAVAPVSEPAVAATTTTGPHGPKPEVDTPQVDTKDAAPTDAKPTLQASTAPVPPRVDGPVTPQAPGTETPGTETPGVEALGTEAAEPEVPKPADFARMRAEAKQPEVPEICTIIAAAAERHALPKPFLARLIWKESRFDVRAVSPVGALGIAQFMPATAKMEGLRNPFDPRQAIEASAKHLADMRREFGNLGLAAIGYNAGRARARAFRGGRDWLPAETVDYVISILGREAGDYADGSTHPVLPLKKGLEFAAACRKLPVIRTRAVVGIPAVRQPWHVQVSRHFARHVAVNMFKRAQKRHAGVLGGLRPVVVIERGPAGMRPQKSVRVGLASRSAAQKLCNRLRQRGAFCLVKKNRGRR